MIDNKKCIVILFVVVISSLLQCGSSVKITFPGCDRAGWKCIKVQLAPIRFLIEYVCPNKDGLSISLWNFNAPVEIRDLHIMNCTSVEIDLTCTSVSRMIESIHIHNVDVLNFTDIVYKDVAKMPEKVHIEDVRSMPLIPQKTFKQMNNIQASVHKCAVNIKPLNVLKFTKVNIGTIQQNAFYNLTDVKIFDWDRVSVDNMAPLSVHVTMEPDTEFVITNSSFSKTDYKSFGIRSPSIRFEANNFQDMPRNVIDATSFDFKFVNNTVDKIHSFAFILLSQNITIENNKINSLKTSALQGIGPGLLQNALMSFGQLKFIYNFHNNTIYHSDIGGLNPDWIAYKNVRSYIYVTSNLLPCSCSELGWITLRGGLGDEFSEMMKFNSKLLNKNNQNLCLNAPCNLPITVMAGMIIQYGQCGAPIELSTWCQKYKPNNTKDLGFGQNAKIVLRRWNRDFPPEEPQGDQAFDDFDDIQSMFELSQKTEDVFSDPKSYLKYKYSLGNPKETFFKLEKTAMTDSLNSDNLLEATGEELNATASPGTILGENITDSEVYINDNKSSTNINNPLNTMRQKFNDGQKEFIKNSYDNWQAARKKRMVYFKVYGNFMTIDP